MPRRSSMERSKDSRHALRGLIAKFRAGADCELRVLNDDSASRKLMMIRLPALSAVSVVGVFDGGMPAHAGVVSLPLGMPDREYDGAIVSDARQ